LYYSYYYYYYYLPPLACHCHSSKTGTVHDPGQVSNEGGREELWCSLWWYVGSNIRCCHIWIGNIVVFRHPQK
jgi:hypothetical protein